MTRVRCLHSESQIGTWDKEHTYFDISIIFEEDAQYISLIVLYCIEYHDIRDHVCD